MIWIRSAKFEVTLVLLCLMSMAALAAQPVITGVSIPNISMKIGDMVTATISVQSDSATVYTLNTSNIGGYPLGSLTKGNSTTYTATFTIPEAGTDYASGDNIPTDVTLADGVSTDTWNTAISQNSDPIDANRPAKPAKPDLVSSSDTGHYNDDNITNDNTSTFQGAAGAVEGNSTVTVTSSIGGQLGTATANADGSWAFTPSSALSDGTHDIAITAIDAAGNESISSDPLSVLIDTQDPPVPGGRNPTDGTYTNDSSPSLSWAVPNDPGESGIYNYRVQVDGPVTRNHYTANTSYAPSLGTEGVYAWRLYAIDLAGNSGSWSDDWSFTIDTTKPAITSVSPTSLADADVGTVTITVTFDEDMDTSVDPTVAVEGLVSSSYTTTNYVWTDSRHFTCQFTFVDDDEEAAGYYSVSGAQDLAKNTMDPDTSHTVDVDTKNPTIASITSSTTDGYYNVGDTIDVTVNFSEEVTLAGGTLDVTLDTGVTVSVAPFASAMNGSGTYTVGAGDNSCDLDSTAIALNGGILQDNAGNDAVIVLPTTTITDGSDIVVDTTNPVINGLTVSDETVDANCEATVTFSATVTDNCCVTPGAVTVLVTLSSGNATLGTPIVSKVQNGQGRVDVTGSVPVSHLDGCPATVQVTIDTVDCCGNSATQSSATGNVIDSITPSIAWTTSLPPSPQYTDANCLITIPIYATVSDNCCISAANVTKSIVVTNNATVVDTVIITQIDDNHVRVSGDITVSALTGCPAVLTVGITGTDCCVNTNSWTSSVNIYDHTIPVISNLVVTDYVLVSPDCCETVVPFVADVTDSCCITPAGITITAANPTDNATIHFSQAEDVVFVQISQGHVGIAGIVHISCLTSCPARVEVRIEATDCCGNDAIPVTSTETQGRVYDVTPPTAVDDPSGAGDTSAVLEPNMDVRLDDYGQYRLMVRQDTPVRIDVIANDTDNCSLCTCCATIWINDIVAQPQYGTLKIETDHGDCNGGSIIRYAPNRGYVGPDRFTYRIVDACGNVSATATVYLDVIRQTVMDDIYLTTCANAAVSFDVTATDLWINPSHPGEIPFVFTTASLPVHGVILGDLADISYAEHGRTTKQIESAMVKLTYVPAEGFIGRDTAGIRFADPFGGESTAAVDVLVSECNEAAERSIVLHHGDLLPIIVPATFAAAYEAGEKEWAIEGEDGGSHTEAISAKKDEHSSTYVLILDTGELTPGRYRATIGIGNGERVIFTVEVKG